jgi:cysteine synthase
MPKGWVSEDKRRILEAYGAEIVEVDPGKRSRRNLKEKRSMEGSLRSCQDGRPWNLRRRIRGTRGMLGRP